MRAIESSVSASGRLNALKVGQINLFFLRMNLVLLIA